MLIQIVSAGVALKLISLLLFIFMASFRRLSLRILWSLVGVVGVMKLWAIIRRTGYKEDRP